MVLKLNGGLAKSQPTHGYWQSFTLHRNSWNVIFILTLNHAAPNSSLEHGKRISLHLSKFFLLCRHKFIRVDMQRRIKHSYHFGDSQGNDFQQYKTTVRTLATIFKPIRENVESDIQNGKTLLERWHHHSTVKSPYCLQMSCHIKTLGYH